MARSANRIVTVGLGLALIALPASAQSSFVLSGFLAARGVRAEGQPSWLEHGFGRLDAGGTGVDERRNRAFATLQLGADWTATRFLDVHAQGLLRSEPRGYGGRRVGITEGFADLHANAGNEQFRLRAGMFFLPTSRENKESLWTSPYTLTLSALNTWIAQEVRPVGVDLQWKHSEFVTVAGTAFRGADSMGTLLAWRGWSLGSRLSVYNEVLPLPPLFSLRNPAILGRQRSDGTTGIGRSNGHTALAGRVRFTLPERANIQFTHVDNHGDRDFYNGEYSWQTKFNIAGGEIGSSGPTTLAAEYSWGTTGMGRPPQAFVQLGFRTAYALVSHKIGANRISARYDTFRTDDRDHSFAETNTEHGHAWTVAFLHDLSDRARIGIEYVTLTAPRPAAAESGFDPNTDGRSVSVELRYRY